MTSRRAMAVAMALEQCYTYTVIIAGEGLTPPPFTFTPPSSRLQALILSENFGENLS